MKNTRFFDVKLRVVCIIEIPCLELYLKIDL